MVGGFSDDNFNSVAYGDVYNSNDFPVDIGVPDAGLQTPAPSQDIYPQSNNTMTERVNVNGPLGKPGHWWLGFALVGGFMIWLARKYSSGDKFSNIKASVYNLFFLTVFIVLMLNLLKVIAANWKIPGFSELILAA